MMLHLHVEHDFEWSEIRSLRESPATTNHGKKVWKWGRGKAAMTIMHWEP